MNTFSSLIKTYANCFGGGGDTADVAIVLELTQHFKRFLSLKINFVD